jgi:hypothetical protein
MEIRKYLLIIGFIVQASVAGAQVKTYLQADSVSKALYDSGDWSGLIHVGKEALADSIDFIGLRSRLGYAYFMTGNYSAAYEQYDHLARADTAEKTESYYAYLCRLYLNDSQGAFFNAGKMGRSLQKDQKLNSFDIYQFDASTGLKWNSDLYRGTATYSMASFGLRLSWRLLLDQSVAYFGQAVSAPDSVVNIDRRGRAETTILTPAIVDSRDNEFEYYAKASFALSRRLTLLGAYHYLQTRYFDDSYYSNIGLLGLKYQGNYFNAQADANFGILVGHSLSQYNVSLMLYPFGNLNIYTISRFSYLQYQTDNLPIFNQAAGFKVFKNTWLETLVTFGRLDNYIDTDGLYIYNSIDVTTFKAGETLFYLIGKHAQLQINYTFEKKQDAQNSINYDQASVTAGIEWKF